MITEIGHFALVLALFVAVVQAGLPKAQRRLSEVFLPPFFSLSIFLCVSAPLWSIKRYFFQSTRRALSAYVF